MIRFPFTLLALLAFTAAAWSSDRPNVLMLCVDDLGPRVGCYGHPLAKTPNIDALATTGLVFDRAFCQYALCSPSRSSLLTGRRPDATKVYDLKTLFRKALPDVVTLPQLFKNNGYYCRSLGKVYHMGHEDPASWNEPAWYSPKPRFGPAGQAMQRENAAKRGTPVRPDGRLPSPLGPAFEAADCGDDDLGDGDTARHAVEVIQGLAKSPEKPFFLAVGFDNPHVPWVAPKKYWDMHDASRIVVPKNNFVPKNAPDFAATTGTDFYRYADVAKDMVITEEYGRKCIHGYLAATTFTDAQIGRVLKALHDNDLAKNTIVLFWGDHGLYMGEHGWWGNKHNTYEGATRVPLVIRVPGMAAAGKHTQALVEFVDIYPTLAQLAKLTPPDNLEGSSFAPLLSNPDLPWKRAAFSQFLKGENMGIAMRTDRYRYTEWRDPAGKLVATELYDHTTDPEENENVVAMKPAVVMELDVQMQEGWRGARPRKK